MSSLDAARQAFAQRAVPAGAQGAVVPEAAVVADPAIAPAATAPERQALHDRFERDGQAGLSETEFTALFAYQEAFAAPVAAPGDPFAASDALGEIHGAMGAYDEAKARAGDLDAELQAELTHYGPALTEDQVAAYERQFREDHAAEYQAVDLALAALAGTLGRHQATIDTLFSADPGVFAMPGEASVARQGVLEAYTTLANTPEFHAEALAFGQSLLAREPLEPSPVEEAMGLVPLDARAIVEGISGPALATAYETDIEDGLDPAAAAERMEAGLAALIPEKHRGEGGPLFELHAEIQTDAAALADLFRGGLEASQQVGEGIASGSTKLGVLGRRLAAAGLVTMVTRFGEAATDGEWGAAMGALVEGAPDGAEMGTLLLGRVGRFAARAQVLNKALLPLTAVTSAIMGIKDLAEGEKAAAIGAGMVALGAGAAIFGATGVGAVLMGLGTAVGLAVELLGGQDLDEAALDEEAERLRRVGVTGGEPGADAAHHLSRSTPGQPQALRDELGLKPDQILALGPMGLGPALLGNQAEGTGPQAAAQTDTLAQVFTDPATGAVDSQALMGFLSHMQRATPDPAQLWAHFNAAMSAFDVVRARATDALTPAQPLGWWLDQVKAIADPAHPDHDAWGNQGFRDGFADSDDAFVWEAIATAAGYGT